SEVKEMRNEPDALMERDIFCDSPLRYTVEQHDKKGDHEVKSAHGVKIGHSYNMVSFFRLLVRR
ncbi:MAG: hypothetical protein JWO91_1488, partial [Acidobacteriaceae bacterium]|nr:hypothetical protein [Acidobacteriaceae bacterium]